MRVRVVRDRIRKPGILTKAFCNFGLGDKIRRSSSSPADRSDSEDDAGVSSTSTTRLLTRCFSAMTSSKTAIGTADCYLESEMDD